MEIQRFPFFPQERSTGNFRRFTDNFTGLSRTSSSWEFPRLFSTVKSLESSSIHAGYGSFRLRIFCGAGAQDIDLFKFLQSVPEFFKPQGTEIAGINKVAVSRGPVPEIRLFKRIAVPGIISPSQKAVQMIGGGKEGKPFRLRQRGNSEGVGLFGMDTDVERRLFSLLFALRQQIAP